ncbi:hypothetical protein CP98_03179 [Sphingobium yanoikuyae]|uniref:Uncharacterized protein n=1 Tax=Sphingobium yanoikuyae TaxID=13690 RepID=A0A084EIA4_SPHYA|nr:hypothetical protein [Sphingobium yanoikuyae]KEZ17696.1 hypothetical protein CP98_03179 [Sphingobium yanoikuyae]
MSTDFSNLIADAVTAKMTPDFIEKEVNSRVEKLIVECIDKSFRSYSDTAKQVEEAVTLALRVENLDLPSYGDMVTRMIKSQIEAVVSPIVAGRLAEDVEGLLKLAPKEIKLSEIANDMRKRHEDEDKWGRVITVIVDDSYYGSPWLYLDDQNHYEDREKSRCAHRLLINKDGTISGGWIDDKDLAKGAWFGRSYGLAQRLRAYIACGTKIILDIDDVVTSVGDY